MLAIVADDLTGATDFAAAVIRTGHRPALTFGVPDDSDVRTLIRTGADVAVAALKIRSLPKDEAISAVRATAETFRRNDVEVVYFKYCSTFDSTAAGNIGPIADELAAMTSSSLVVHVPAYPENGRTVYQGQLFVNGELLDRSPMRYHPLNPMTDSDIRRLLLPQTKHEVGNVRYQDIRSGPDHLRSVLRRESPQPGTVRHLICDTISDLDVQVIADSLESTALVSGGAPMGAALCAGRLPSRPARSDLPSAPVDSVPPEGPSVVIAGSASTATARQIAAFPGPVKRLSPAELTDTTTARRVVDWAAQRWNSSPVLIAPTARDAQIKRAAAVDDQSRAVEKGLGAVCAALAESGARRIVVAGGETSGAVVEALGLRSVLVAHEICTGVPWTVDPQTELWLAFKSGNFGPETFFADAFEAMVAA